MKDRALYIGLIFLAGIWGLLLVIAVRANEIVLILEATR